MYISFLCQHLNNLLASRLLHILHEPYTGMDNSSLYDNSMPMSVMSPHKMNLRYRQHDVGGTPRSSLIFVSCTWGTLDILQENAVTTEKRVDGREQKGQSGGWQAKWWAQLNPKCGGKKRFDAVLDEYLGWGEVLSILLKEKRGDDVTKKIMQPVGHVLWLMKPH